jgi:lipopolysaccharide export system protein LptA
VKKLLLCVMLCVCATPMFAQQNNGKFGTLEEDSDKEVNATADTMIVEEELGYSILEGDVVVIQGGTKLVARKVRAEYTEDRSEIEVVIATGDVVLTSGEDIAKSDVAHYYLLKDVIILTGNAYVKQGKDTLTAQRVDINTKTGSATMTGRVTTVLTPNREKTDDTSNPSQ